MSEDKLKELYTEQELKDRLEVEKEAALAGFIHAPVRINESTMMIMTKAQWILVGGTEEGWEWMQENGYASKIDWGSEDE